MKRLIAITLVLLGGAAATLRASADLTPRLSAATVGDSVRVIARWSAPCDLRGCADSVRVEWLNAPQRYTKSAADTLWIAAPTWGDSVRVSVQISSMRRGVLSASRTASTVVRRLDAPPPAPDSVRVDTLALREQLADLAERDSFPVVVVRNAEGVSESRLGVADSMQLCALGRNRYTGRIAIFTEWSATDAELQRIDAVCASAAARYAAERGG